MVRFMETHFDLSSIDSDIFKVKDRKTTFSTTADPIYMAIEHVENFSLSFLAKSFVKELLNDSKKFIASCVNE